MKRIIELSIQKLRIMTGGSAAACVMLAAALLILLAAACALKTSAPEALRLAVFDGDGTALSREFVSSLQASEKGAVELINAENERQAMSIIENGGAEGAVVIEKGFEAALRSGGAAVSYYPAAGTSTAEAARELIAGRAVVLRSRLRAKAYAEQLMGRELNDDEIHQLDELVKSYNENARRPVELLTVNDGDSKLVEKRTALGAYLTRYSGFTAFIIMLFVMLSAASLGSNEARAALNRMLAIRRGAYIEAVSNLGALMVIGLAISLISFIAGEWPFSGGFAFPSPRQLAASAAYVFASAALAALVGRLADSGRIELIAPAAALATSLFGGCFIDPSALGGTLKLLALFTPQGQYLAALDGGAANLAILLSVGMIAFFAANTSMLFRPGYRR